MKSTNRGSASPTSSGAPSSSSSPTTPSSSASKVCVVCGDKSYGLNFNAITCESCKAFFRRNALSTKELFCPFSNVCTITVVTRRFCQKCRLVKCFAEGMKKEHIMSEEDKLMKRRKIEINRAKKNGTTKAHSTLTPDEPPVKVKREFMDVGDSPTTTTNASTPLLDDLELSSNTSSFDGALLPGLDSMVATPSTPSTPAGPPAAQAAEGDEASRYVLPTMEASPTELVNSIIDSPVGSTRVIGHLMKTPHDAILVMEKIINSPKDAIQLIGHFIGSPGDALKIISKIMNSPFDALTIFTKFMSSPTDALEVITKIISSPSDVLQFLQQLMRSPEDGLEIMNKFMNNPAEALRMINSMMNQTKVDSTTTEGGGSGDGGGAVGASGQDESRESESGGGGDSSCHEHLIDNSEAIMNNSAQLKVILDRMGEHLNRASPTSSLSNLPTSSTHDGEAPETPPPQTSDDGRPVTTRTINAEKEEEEEEKYLGSPAEVQMATPPPPVIPPHPIFPFIGGTGGGVTTTQDIIDMCINQSVGVNSLDSILCEAIKLEYECAMPGGHGMGGMPNASPSMYASPPGAGMDVRALNDVEQAKLNELILAHQALYAPVDEDISSLIADDYRLKQSDQQGADPQLLTLINLTAVAIRRLIKMSKKISAFKNMCQEDQVALLKGGCTEMMMLRSVMQYDSDQASWKIPHIKEAMSSLKADILKLARGPVYEEHERFILTFEPKWRQDENIILIMCAIILFTPDRPKTIHSDVIKLEQNSYYYLLRRYLESVYPGCEAKSTFMRLIQKVHELRKFNEAVISVYLDVNPAEVEPLLREIFDLKH